MYFERKRWPALGAVLIAIVATVAGQTDSPRSISLYRFGRDFLFNFVGQNRRSDDVLKFNKQSHKLQKQWPTSMEFFCDPKGPGARSATPPLSVHKLHPGDIDVIGAMGDSLTAGNGALATNILEVMTENKGMSWTIGGQGDWHSYLTIPNILKVFNPKLYGYSLADGISVYRSSRFNVAEIGAMSRDIPHQAEILIKRMTNDPNVDMEKHWKMVSLMIGSNDFCSDVCFRSSPTSTIALHEQDLLTALRTLRDNLPRTMVNIVLNPTMKILHEFRGKPNQCVSAHYVECPCMFGTRMESKRKLMYQIMEKWRAVQEKVANLEEFHNRNDFTVNIALFFKNVVFPRLDNGMSDFSYMSMDCFHVSQKGYAIATNALWNSFWEPAGSKSTNWKKEFAEVKCPTDAHPYIRTIKN